MVIRYSFRFVSVRVFTLDLADEATVIDAKLHIQEQFPEVDPTATILVHRASILDDKAALSSTNVTAADYIVVQPLSFRRRAAALDIVDLPIGCPLVAPPPDPAVDTLVRMGFDADQSRRALAAEGGDVQRAVDLLLIGKPIRDTPSPPARQSRDQDDVERLPSGMPVSWARELAANPDFFESLVAQLIQNSPENVAAGFRENPAMIIRDAGLDPARFDVEGVRRRVAHLRGAPAVPPEPGVQIDVILRLQQEFPTFQIGMLLEVLGSFGLDEAAAKEHLRQMMQG
jgi:hypothetical protein